MGGFFRFVKGFLIGAAVGGGATLLLAPWGGTELRELVKEAEPIIRKYMDIDYDSDAKGWGNRDDVSNLWLERARKVLNE